VRWRPQIAADHDIVVDNGCDDHHDDHLVLDVVHDDQFHDHAACCDDGQTVDDDFLGDAASHSV
jgi:hypothetical protein